MNMRLRGQTVLEPARLDPLHDLLMERGWEIDEHYLVEDGYPRDHEVYWTYPASYGGAEINQVGDATPCPLTCRVVPDGEGWLEINVELAGNEQGCPEHWHAYHVVPISEDELERLATLLDQVEPQARSLDPRMLIECRFFGPCGHNNTTVSTL